MDPILCRLGIDRYRTRADLARWMGVDPALLAPSRFLPGSPLYTDVQAALMHLAGVRVGLTPRAALLVERLDEGEYSIGALTDRLAVWGMATADDWVVRLHAAGAPVEHAAGGWTRVRRWARKVCA